MLGWLAGCDAVYGLATVPPSLDGSASRDGGACVTPDQSDTFDTAPACSAWGTQLTNNPAYQQIENGALVMLPVGAAAGCESKALMPFARDGVFAEVAGIGTGTGQYNGLVAFADGQETDATALQITANPDVFHFLAYGQDRGFISYDPALRWWRIRPSGDRAFVVGEVSADGQLWSEVGRDATPPPASIKAKLQSGLFGAGPATAMTVASFDVCP